MGMDSYNFVTRKMTSSMDYTVSTINEIFILNRALLNVNDMDTSQKFNRCTVIMYYVGKDLRYKSSLDMHSDCVYFETDMKNMTHYNSQVENNSCSYLFLER